MTRTIIISFCHHRIVKQSQILHKTIAHIHTGYGKDKTSSSPVDLSVIYEADFFLQKVTDNALKIIEQSPSACVKSTAVRICQRHFLLSRKIYQNASEMVFLADDYADGINNDRDNIQAIEHHKKKLEDLIYSETDPLFSKEKRSMT